MMSGRKLAVLDLDETLIHSRPVPEGSPQAHYYDGFTWYEVILRPYLHEFLIELSRLYDIAVWTAGSSCYANFIVALFPREVKLVFVFSSRQCTIKMISMTNGLQSGPIVIKNMKKVWSKKRYTKFNTVVIDNTPSTYKKNYGNAIQVLDFIGDPEDRELHRILEILKRIADHPNVRESLRDYQI